jgi:hypothetical protein
MTSTPSGFLKWLNERFPAPPRKPEPVWKALAYRERHKPHAR